MWGELLLLWCELLLTTELLLLWCELLLLPVTLSGCTDPCRRNA